MEVLVAFSLVSSQNRRLGAGVERELPGVSSQRVTNPFVGAPPSWPNYLPKTPNLQMPSCWGLGFQCMNLAGTPTLDPAPSRDGKTGSAFCKPEVLGLLNLPGPLIPHLQNRTKSALWVRRNIEKKIQDHTWHHTSSYSGIQWSQGVRVTFCVKGPLFDFLTASSSKLQEHEIYGIWLIESGPHLIPVSSLVEKYSSSSDGKVYKREKEESWKSSLKTEPMQVPRPWGCKVWSSVWLMLPGKFWPSAQNGNPHSLPSEAIVGTEGCSKATSSSRWHLLEVAFAVELCSCDPVICFSMEILLCFSFAIVQNWRHSISTRRRSWEVHPTTFPNGAVGLLPGPGVPACIATGQREGGRRRKEAKIKPFSTTPALRALRSWDLSTPDRVPPGESASLGTVLLIHSFSLRMKSLSLQSCLCKGTTSPIFQPLVSLCRSNSIRHEKGCYLEPLASGLGWLCGLRQVI